MILTSESHHTIVIGDAKSKTTQTAKEGERPVSGRDDTRRRGTRGVVREIDQQLNRLDREEKALGRERERLLAARVALAGKASAGPARGKRISQDDIAAFLSEHPGSLPAQVAEALGVPVTNVSTHLYRAKDTRFQRHKDGWHLISRGGDTHGRKDRR
jgi:hypothetical protein